MKVSDKTVLIRLFHALLSEKGLRAQIASILEGLGVESTKDLTINQLVDAIESLARMKSSRENSTQPLRDARSMVLKSLEAIGVVAINNNWDHVNNYLKQPRIAGKLLYQMNLDELKACNRKLKSIKVKRDKLIAEENRLAQNN